MSDVHHTFPLRKHHGRFMGEGALLLCMPFPPYTGVSVYDCVCVHGVYAHHVIAVMVCASDRQRKRDVWRVSTRLSTTSRQTYPPKRRR